ncbi:signal transduction protein, partial [Bacillus infantis]
MAYKKTEWKDTIKDQQGNILEKGTPLNAANLNNIEDGVNEISDKIGNLLDKNTQIDA